MVYHCAFKFFCFYYSDHKASKDHYIIVRLITTTPLFILLQILFYKEVYMMNLLLRINDLVIKVYLTMRPLHS